MKSTLLKSAFVAVVGLAFCAPVALRAQTPAAAPAPSAAPAASTKAAKPTSYKGTVKSIDTSANTICVTCSKGDMTMSTTDATKVKVDGKVAKLADITMGEKVTGSYTKDSTGAMTAYSIHGKTK